MTQLHGHTYRDRDFSAGYSSVPSPGLKGRWGPVFIRSTRRRGGNEYHTLVEHSIQAGPETREHPSPV